MKITNLGVANTSLPSQPQVEAAGAAGGGESAETSAANAKGYTPSSELLRLVDLVKQLPGVREDHVQAAAQRLAQGYYHTQASIENTAAAMLNTPE
jgi:hypothetical protein